MSLIEWAKKGEIEEVRKCIQQGADVNAHEDNTGWTALSRASCNGHNEIVTMLLENGADIEAKAKDGATVLIMAVSWGHEKGVEVLLEYGADVDFKNFAGLEYGYNPSYARILKMLKDEIERRKQLKMARYTLLRHTNFHLAQEIALRTN